MKPLKLSRTALLGLLVLSLLACGAFIFASRSAAQTGQLADSSGVWSIVDESRLPAAPAGTRLIVPERYRTVSLNTAALRTRLASAPMEFTPQAKGGGRVEITLPMP